jgi:predicted  nucleic acid-binding Zn-ribbon protein
MKTKHVILAMIMTAHGHADESTAPVIDLEARKASVVNLEARISQLQERLAELGTEIVNLDVRIENRIAEQVELLANMRDSQDSRFKVSKMKREAIEALHQGTEAYARKRAEMAEKSRVGDASALEDLEKFDERTLVRVDQIIELTQSFPTHRDVEKYEYHATNYWDGYYHENTRISGDWRQARRDESQGNLQRRQTAEALRDGIEQAQSRRNALVDNLERRSLSDVEREFTIREIGRKDAMITQLKRQQQGIIVHGAHSYTRMPGLDEAIDIEHLLLDQRRNLREDVSRLFRLYDVFTRERAKTAALQENLEARKAWLKEHGGEP